ncbi:hypothetical protein [Microvirgula aerodenitrificans]|uniref:hypothetical protein n=1 Tax=Microvirgula aerodenitrificans TaxID=57480 RepID=UPI0028E909F8|nr:hypothetical protein [Microvirgula aerodenitrificans]
MLFYSNVFNIIDWSINNIEPCTGMYIRTIKLAHVSGNKLQGPDLDICLRFNQFNASDYGFGVGWELNLSSVEMQTYEDGETYDMLVLSNGQRYIIEETEQDFYLQYQRTQTFVFEKDGVDPNGGACYKIINKNGTIEYITDNKTTEIRSPNGYSIYIKWGEGEGDFVMTDNGGVVLIKSEKISSGDQNASGDFRQVTSARCIMNYIFSPIEEKNALTKITGGKTASTLADTIYEIAYQTHNDHYLAISKVSSYMQFTQIATLEYQKLKHTDLLGCEVLAVSSLVISTVKNPALRKITHVASESNYLGSGVVSGWVEGVDNLDKLSSTFRFVTTEKTGRKRVVWRTYNKFYLLMREQILAAGDLPSTVKTGQYSLYDYKLNAAEGTGTNDQSSTYMLPVKHTLCWQDVKKDGSLGLRQQCASFQYDDDANLTCFDGFNGIQEQYDYYPATGEKNSSGIELCPADPNGFIHYAKKKTVSAINPTSNTINKCYGYTYEKMPGVDLIVLGTENFSTGTTDPDDIQARKAQKKYSYQTEGVFIGQLKQVIEQMPPFTQGPDGTVSADIYKTTINYTYTLASSGLIIQKTIIGYDNAEKNNSLVQDVNTTDVIRVVDENRLETLYEYNYLGLLEKTVRSYGSETEVAETISYSANTNTLTRKNSNEKLTTHQILDMYGRVVREAVKVGEGVNEKTYRLLACFYNDVNQLVKKNEFDHSSDGTVIIKEETLYSWTLFDEPKSQINPDGSEETYTYDYLNNTIAVLQIPAYENKISFYDELSRLQTRKTYSKDNPDQKMLPDIMETFVYDDLNRQIKYTATGKESQTYAYDAFDRPSEQTGSTSGKRTTEYAPHCSADLAVKIAIGSPDGTSTTIGLRSYDGLDREISSTINGVQKSYDYSTSEILTNPNRISISSGRVFEYQYSKSFDRVTLRKVSDSKGNELAAKTLKYDNKSGHLSESYAYPANTDTGEEDWEGCRLLQYNEFNNVIHEKVEWKNFIKGYFGVFETYTTSTIKGRPVEIASYMGNVRIAILKIKYAYEKNGGVKQMDYYVNNELASRSIFYRYKNGNLKEIKNFAKLENGQYAGIAQHFLYGKYGLLKRVYYSSIEDKTGEGFMAYGLEYDANQRLVKSSYDIYAVASKGWTEKLSYNDVDTLVSWEKTGDLDCRDEYGNSVISMKFKMDDIGNIQQLSSEYSTGSNVAKYSYSNQSSLSLVANNRSDTVSMPDNIQFSSDSEGNITGCVSKMGEKTLNTIAYDFAGEDNISDLTVTTGPSSRLHHYDYDAEGRNVMKYQVVNGTEYLIDFSLHISDQLMAEQHYLLGNEDNTTQYTVFHRINGEVMFISTVDNKQKLKTLPCFNQRNGSQLMIGEPGHGFVDDPRMRGKKMARCYYNLYITGQNAYGMNYSPAQSRYVIMKIYNTASDQPDPPPPPEE